MRAPTRSSGTSSRSASSGCRGSRDRADMDFSFTDDQLLFRDAVRALLTDRCPPSRVRAAWDDAGGAGFDRDLWASLAEMGILGLLGPEASGGLGLSMLDLVLVLEETGRAALPGPIV